MDHFTWDSTCDHVLMEAFAAWAIDDGGIVFAGPKLPQGDVNCDATLSLCPHLVWLLGVLEGTIAHLGTGRKHNVLVASRQVYYFGL